MHERNEEVKEIYGFYLVKYDYIILFLFNLNSANFFQECDFKVNFTNVIHRVIVKLGAEVMYRRKQGEGGSCRLVTIVVWDFWRVSNFEVYIIGRAASNKIIP